MFPFLHFNTATREEYSMIFRAIADLKAHPTRTQTPESVVNPHLQVVEHNHSKYLLTAVVLTIAFTSYIYLTQSLRSSIPDHGDFWTDMALIVAARNLDQYGFVNLCFGISKDSGPAVGLPAIFYTHHPSIPTMVLGVFERLGLSVTTARLAPLIVASSGLLAISLLVQNLFGWKVGIAALVAMAALAPFRLLSDAFGYQSYDFAAKLWTLLFITLGCLTVGRRQLMWFLIAGGAAFAAMALTGFEMVPAIGAYSVLFPLLFVQGNRRVRVRTMLLSGFCVGIGLITGLLSRVPQSVCMLGSVNAVATDLLAAFKTRTATDYGGVMWGRTFLPELLHRAWVYYSLHLVLIAVGFGIASVLAAMKRARINWYAFKWLGLIFCCEVIWFTIFREHSHRHVHTIYQVTISISFATALAAVTIWSCLKETLLGRVLAVGVGAAWLGACLAFVNVQPYGNVQTVMDWQQQEQQFQLLDSHVPADAVVVIDEPSEDPSLEFFLERAFLRRPEPVSVPSQQAQPAFLLTSIHADNPLYARSLYDKRLLFATPDLALFDRQASSGVLNTFVKNTHLESLRSWNVTMPAVAVHPKLSGVDAPDSLTLPVPPSATNVTTFWITQPEWNIDKTDGVDLTFTLQTANGTVTPLSQLALTPDMVQAKHGWVPVDITIPEHGEEVSLRIQADCGPAHNCNYDWVWIAP